MKPNKTIWKRIAFAGAFLVLAACSVSIWQKHSFCQGWADHHASLANQLRASAADPGLTPAEQREQLVAAGWNEIISAKYAAVAHRPWRPYPDAPLITPDERQAVASRH